MTTVSNIAPNSASTPLSTYAPPAKVVQLVMAPPVAYSQGPVSPINLAAPPTYKGPVLDIDPATGKPYAGNGTQHLGALDGTASSADTRKKHPHRNNLGSGWMAYKAQQNANNADTSPNTSTSPASPTDSAANPNNITPPPPTSGGGGGGGIPGGDMPTDTSGLIDNGGAQPQPTFYQAHKTGVWIAIVIVVVILGVVMYRHRAVLKKDIKKL